MPVQGGPACGAGAGVVYRDLMTAGAPTGGCNEVLGRTAVDQDRMALGNRVLSDHNKDSGNAEAACPAMVRQAPAPTGRASPFSPVTTS